MAKKKVTKEIPDAEIEAVKFYAECTVCEWKSECMTSAPTICGSCGANTVLFRCGVVRE